MLDQINSWNLDPELLIDFLFLPDSYFHPDAPIQFDKFILRYGTHVVVSAKFGGEFKMLNTQRKSKSASIEKFAEKCTADSLKLMSRTVNFNMNLLVATVNVKNTQDDNNSEKQSSGNEKNTNVT